MLCLTGIAQCNASRCEEVCTAIVLQLRSWSYQQVSSSRHEQRGGCTPWHVACGECTLCGMCRALHKLTTLLCGREEQLIPAPPWQAASDAVDSRACCCYHLQAAAGDLISCRFYDSSTLSRPAGQCPSSPESPCNIITLNVGGSGCPRIVVCWL